MFDAQKMLLDFCFGHGFHQTEIVKDTEVLCVDDDKQPRRLVLTLYGDIYDVDAQRIIARSNGSHIYMEPYRRPTSWTLIEDEPDPEPCGAACALH